MHSASFAPLAGTGTTKGRGIYWFSDGVHPILKCHSSQPWPPVLFRNKMAKFCYQELGYRYLPSECLSYYPTGQVLQIQVCNVGFTIFGSSLQLKPSSHAKCAQRQQWPTQNFSFCDGKPTFVAGDSLCCIYRAMLSSTISKPGLKNLSVLFLGKI